MTNNDHPHISVVIPLYNCSQFVEQLCSRLIQTLETITEDFEIILVNDASPQNDWEIIRGLAERNIRIKGLNLSKNFGQHFAITAGIDHALGDWIVVMDGDLQDPPEEIVKLYKCAQQGYDTVFGCKSLRKDAIGKRLLSKSFHRVFDYLADTSTDNRVGNFSICSGEVARNFRLLREHNRSYPDFVRWMGYRVAYVDIEHAPRLEGESSYSLSKRLKLANQIIVALSNKPLRISIGFGFIMAAISLICGLILVGRYIFFSKPLAGWTSVMVSIYLIGGLLFLNLGIIGVYIGRIFDETKNRPLYLVKEKINVKP